MKYSNLTRQLWNNTRKVPVNWAMCVDSNLHSPAILLIFRRGREFHWQTLLNCYRLKRISPWRRFQELPVLSTIKWCFLNNSFKLLSYHLKSKDYRFPSNFFDREILKSIAKVLHVFSRNFTRFPWIIAKASQLASPCLKWKSKLDKWLPV